MATENTLKKQCYHCFFDVFSATNILRASAQFWVVVCILLGTNIADLREQILSTPSAKNSNLVPRNDSTLVLPNGSTLVLPNGSTLVPPNGHLWLLEMVTYGSSKWSPMAPRNGHPWLLEMYQHWLFEMAHVWFLEMAQVWFLEMAQSWFLEMDQTGSSKWLK